MENKDIIRTFCGCKPSKKTTLCIIKILLVLIKKTWSLWIDSKIRRISKSKKIRKLWQKLSGQQNMKLKSRFIWEKKKRIIISEMPFCNVFRRADLDCCVNDNFPGTFADFRLKIITQEKISSYGNLCP